ncbi:asparaginase [Castellaniella sp.]|uniref:asparaginase n=1 Tax=Castellaniella sp. TaxID=1955812 RepID=UPI003C71D386
MKNVVVVSTGGTIASLPGPEGRNVAGALSGQALLGGVPEAADIRVEVRSLFQKPSNALTLDDLQVLRAQCQALIDSGRVDGIVVTHGTDTLEDTAYFLESSLRTRHVVVVVTGSQRVPHAPGTDAYLNLRHALRVAASADCSGLGVLVVFNETIHAAAFARKTSSFQLNGFDSPGFGCLGFIDDDAALVYQQPRRQPLLQPPPGTLPAVELLSACLGAGPLALRALVDAGVSGIVLEGIGRGQVPPDWMPEVRRAVAAGCAVLVCSSALTGPVLPCYEYAGSLHDLQAAGALGVSGLSGRKVRLRLMLALACLGEERDRDAIRRLFSWGADRSA